MLIGFADDTDLNISGRSTQPDIFVYGGYFISQDRLEALQSRIREVKASHGLPWHAPVKWNLRDQSLVSFYASGNLLSQAEYTTLLACGDCIRRELLALLSAFDARVIVSARYDVALKKSQQKQLFTWAFENFAQRVGRMAEAMNTAQNTACSVILVADWPRGGLEKTLMDTYAGGYYYGRGSATGQAYFSGALKALRFSDSLFHGSTLHSGPLQLADLVVGCSREFLLWATRGTRAQKAKEYFCSIADRFYCDAQSGKIDGYGFKLAKNPTAIDIDQRIADLKALAEHVRE